MAGAVALLLRVWYVLDMRVHHALFDAPILDAALYDAWARGALDDVFAHGPHLRPPLYAWFLQAMLALDDGYLLPRLAQAVGAAGTVALVADAGRRLAGPLAGLAGGLLLAMHWPSVYFSGELLPVTLAVLLATAALWAFTRAGLEDRALWAGVGAVALGLASIAHPASLAFVVVLLLLPWWVWPRIGARRLANARGTLAVGLLVVALAPGLAVTVRNGLVGNEWVFITSRGGVELYLGNHLQSDGQKSAAPGASSWREGHEAIVSRAEADRGRAMRPREVNRHYAVEAVRFWTSHPGAALRLYGHKLRLLLGAGERSDGQNIHFWRQQSPVLGAPVWTSWATLLSLGLVGLVLLRRRWSAAPFTGFLVTYALALLLLRVNEPGRLPLTPALAVLAGAGVTTIVQAARSRLWPRLVAILLAVGAVYVLTSLDRLGFDENDVEADALSRVVLGNAHLDEGEPARAEAAYRDALRVAEQGAPTGFEEFEPTLQMNLARALLAQLKLTDLEAQLRHLESTQGKGYAVRLLWAKYYLAKHDYRRAFVRFRDLSDESPEDWEALLGLGWCQIQNRAYQTSLNTFDKVLDLKPGQANAIAGKGVAQMLGWENYEVARGLLEKALRIDPTVAAAHHYLGNYYFRHAQDRAKMVLHLREALRLDPYNNEVRRFLVRNRIPHDTPMPGAYQP